MQELLNHRRNLERLRERLENIIDNEINSRLYVIDEAIEKAKANEAGLTETGDPKYPYIGTDAQFDKLNQLNKYLCT